jgi:hypothetical protein
MERTGMNLISMSDIQWVLKKAFLMYVNRAHAASLIEDASSVVTYVAWHCGPGRGDRGY